LRPYRDKPLVWVILDEISKVKIHARLVKDNGDGTFVVWCPVHEREYIANKIKEVDPEDLK